jgi:hypothetical protein
MGSLTCTPGCPSNPAVALVSMPCFKCVIPAG